MRRRLLSFWRSWQSMKMPRSAGELQENKKTPAEAVAQLAADEDAEVCAGELRGMRRHLPRFWRRWQPMTRAVFVRMGRGGQMRTRLLSFWRSWQSMNFPRCAAEWGAGEMRTRLPRSGLALAIDEYGDVRAGVAGE